MHSLVRTSWVALAAIAASSLPAVAAQPNICVPRALGVPTRNEPPKWVNWTGSTGNLDESLDDPRWQGATGQSFFNTGGAKAPLALRALWSDQGGEYLYLSFIMDVTGLTGGGTETPRDLFVGFRRNAAVGGEQGYVFQFHLTSGQSTTLIDPVYCPLNSQCPETAATPKNYWRVYADKSAAPSGGECGTGGASPGRIFNTLPGPDSSTPPFDWISTKQAVRFWKQSANRWAVQMRVPIVDAGLPISAGIERGSTLWYQATSRTSGGGDFANLAWFPRDLTTSVCYQSALNGYLVHKELDDPTHWSKLHLPSMPAPSACDTGLELTTAQVGSLPDYTGSNLANETVTVGFKAVRADGVTPVVNTVVAQPKNTSGAAIQVPLAARFRLAAWGSAPWSDPADTGKWKDMRGTVPTTAGQQPGLCLGSSDPNVDDACNPAISIPAGQRAAISFHWTIGDDTGTGGIGKSEYCKYGLTPPAGQGTCQACLCTGAGAKCDVTTDAGIQSTKAGGGLWPCVSVNYPHQCMLVELSAPNGNVNFVQQSAWNNMTFGQMSLLKQEALIDARGLPKAPGQQFQDIYLIAMPRNMPASLPPTTTGTDFVRSQAFARAAELAKPFEEDLRRLSPEEIRRIACRLKHPIPGDQQGCGEGSGSNGPVIERRELDRADDEMTKRNTEQERRIQLARVIMDDETYHRVGNLLEVATASGKAAALTERVVRSVGASAAADVVPTLDIYPYYQPNGTGHAYMPMTSFTVFLSHEGAMAGIDWLIDGAVKEGENIYHLRIPVDHARRIQIRSQAVEPPEVPIGRNNPSWPCASGCACGGGGARSCGLVSIVGNTAPGLVAGVFVIVRRRKRRKTA